MTRSLSAGQYHMVAIAEWTEEPLGCKPKMRSGFGLALNPAGVRKRGITSCSLQ